MSNPNLLGWITDCHVTSDDAEAGGLGDTRPYEAMAVVSHIRGLDLAGVVDTGDCKDHYGLVGTEDEHDNYINIIQGGMPWLPVNPAGDVNATYPILPGNHDALDDYLTAGSSWNLAPFDAKFWAAPYHWTADWAGPQIRIIALHARMRHVDETQPGTWDMDLAEVTWLEDQLDALPAGWKAIVATHAPMITALGSNLDLSHGGTEVLAVLAANVSKVVACLCGHRHVNFNSALDGAGIRHITLPSLAYGANNGNGGFTIIEYRPGTDDFKFHYRLGPGSQGLFGVFKPSVYTPLVVAR